MSYRSGFGFVPMDSADYSTVQNSPLNASNLINGALSFVPGGNLVGSLITAIGSLFGAAPRGNFAKFKRTAYPYMRTLAAQSGINVTIGWFGDIVLVKPDGSFGVIAPQTPNYESAIINMGYHPFYAATCSEGVDCVNNPSKLGWQLFDPLGEAAASQSGYNSGQIAPTITPTATQTGILTGSTTTPQMDVSGQINRAGMDIKDMMLYGGLAVGIFLLLTDTRKK